MFRSKKILVFLLLICAVFISYNFFNQNKEENIEKVLKTKEYSYLPKEAKNYIRSVYESTGEIILTEKNKKKNVPYLNPSYANYLSLSDKEKKEQEIIPETYVIDYIYQNIKGTNDLPSYYNITDVDGKNFITPINQQGGLGLCWAFTAIEQAESNLMVKSNQSYSETSQRFSVRQLDYATSTNGIKNYKNENGYRELGEGGNFYISSMIMTHGLSLTEYTEYEQSTNKKELADVLNLKNSKYELDSAIIMPRLSNYPSNYTRTEYINIVKDSIMKYGGAYVGTGSPDGPCGFKNKDGEYTIVDYGSCVGSSGHAMQIVGWDDNYEYEYCRSNNSNLSLDSPECSKKEPIIEKGAWILRNSWGEESEYKYVYLGYSSNDQDIAFATTLTNTNNKSWDNIYHKNLVKGSIYTTSETEVFNKKINTEEKVEKIKFMTASSNGTYNISVESGSNVYKDIDTIETDLPGIYTVDLSSKNIILTDSKFKVTINSTNKTYVMSNTLSIHTSNINKEPIIKTDDIDGSLINKNDDNYEVIIYSSTKNIDSNEEVTYSIYKDNIDYSNYIISYSGNKVAENNINATMLIDKEIPTGIYKLKVTYNGNTYESNLSIPTKSQLEGSGTKDDPYLIHNENELNQIRYDLDAYYSLENNITLTKNWIPIGSSLKPFKGGLDGNNHTIKGLKIVGNSDEPVGFFGTVAAKYQYSSINGDVNDRTYIKNLKLENAQVSNLGDASILIGQLIYSKNSVPDIAYNYGYPIVTIDNVHFIDGNVTSINENSGVIIGSIEFTPIRTASNLNINNSYSSVTISGKNSSGLIGYIYDPGSAERSKLSIEMTNFQNVGIIDVKSQNIEYSDEDNYSAVIGGINGNAEVKMSNYIINTIFNDPEYMANYCSYKNRYYIGYFDPNNSTDIAVNISNGYYISSYHNKINNIYSSLDDIKDTSIYDSWTDFNKYWKIETIDGITRIPILKSIDYNYTSTSEIVINRYDKVSLLDYINEKSDYQYINYSIISNNQIINISRKAINCEEYNDIVIEALNKGVAIIHVENYYDGYEKDILITVTAEKVDKPIITYYYNDETYNQQVNALESFKLTKNQFIRKGYSFKGWNTMPNGTGESYTDEEMIESGIDENLKLYAQWTSKKYTIRFNANGGTGTMEDLTNQTIEVTYMLPNNTYTRENYIFKEWNSKVDGTGISIKNRGSVSIENLISDEGTIITLYAQWKKVIGTITFNANGGQGEPRTQTFTYNTDTKLDINAFERKDYIFGGWNTKADGTGTTYRDEAIVNFPEDTTLYAQWTKNTGIITFNSNGGTEATRIQDFEYNTDTRLGRNAFDKEGYTFKNWNTKIDGSGTTYENRAIVNFPEDTTLYAQWTPITYKLNLNANNGSEDVVEQVLTYDKSEKITKNTFTKTSYKFKNWNTKADGTGTTYTDEQEVINLSNTQDSVVNLYAQWTKNTGIITFNSNGGDEETRIQDFTYNTDTRLGINVFKKVGYTFKNWNTKIDGSGTTYENRAIVNFPEDTTLYAQWTPITYRIYLNSNNGTGDAIEQVLTYDKAEKLIKNTFTRENYVFKGWNTAPYGPGTRYSDEQVVKNLANTQNATIDLYAEWQELTDFIINTYDVDETNNYISKIMINTDVDKFKESITLGPGYTVEVEYKTINGKNLLYTGGKTRIMYGTEVYKEYTNVVIGDINGDAEINSADLLKVRQHLLETKILTGVYFLASDINYDNSINSADLFRIRQHLLGTKLIGMEE